MLNYVKSTFSFRQEKKLLLYILLIAFLLSFAVARAWSLGIGNGIYFEGFHIHHFYFGMLVLTVGGLLGLLSVRKSNRRVAAALMGIGMGLFADEIGLLLNCTTDNRICSYAFPDSLDIIGTISLTIVLVLILVDFLERSAVKSELKKNKSRPPEVTNPSTEPQIINPSKSIR